MKHVLLAFCAVCIAMSAVARPVTLEEAKANAQSFIHQSNGMKKGKGAVQSLTLVHTITQDGRPDGTPALYIFNSCDRQRFVVTSADDVALPILGYGDAGGFSSDTIPSNTMALLQTYVDQIAAAKKAGAPAAEMAKAKRAGWKSVPYLVPVTWDQRAPYNDQCVFDGHSCATGCVATAMAQIMYYWAVTGRDGQKFRHGCQALAGYTSTYSYYNVPALEAVESFDWDAMDEGSATPTSDAAKQAVAQLMRYCGQSALMGYGTSASNTDINSALAGMKKCGYCSEMKSIDSYDYSNNGQEFTYEILEELLYNEVKRKRPVLIGIFMKSLKHVLVCDGYDAEDNSFHLNWGWGGESDGYYVLDATLRNSGATAESYTVTANIQPDVSTYGLLSTDGKTFSLYRDNMKGKRPGTVVEQKFYNDDGVRYSWSASMGEEAVEQVERIVIDKSFRDETIKSGAEYFFGFPSVETIIGLEYFDTFGVRNMANMFGNCYELTSLDLSHFDTSKVSSMQEMFSYCYNLGSLDLSSFDTSNVTTMESMFYHCYNLAKLDVSHFDTSKVGNMNVMFYGCSFERLDLSNFVISEDVTSYTMSGNEATTCQTEGMLAYCSALRWLKISPSMSLLFEDSSDEEFYVYGGSACKKVGKFNPCVIVAPDDFDFGTDTSGIFYWKGGRFHLPYPLGDVNHDGSVSITDVTMVVDYLKGDWWFDNFDVISADVNGDNTVTVADVTLIVKMIVGE